MLKFEVINEFPLDSKASLRKILIQFTGSASKTLKALSDAEWKTLWLVITLLCEKNAASFELREFAASSGLSEEEAANRLSDLASKEDTTGLTLVQTAGRYFVTSPGTIDESSKKYEVTTRDLILELTHKLFSIRGIAPQRSWYGVIGKALEKYGFEAVNAAIDDIEIECNLRNALGRGFPAQSEITKMLMARASWNQNQQEVVQSSLNNKEKRNFWDEYSWDAEKRNLYSKNGLSAKVVGNVIVMAMTPPDGGSSER